MADEMTPDQNPPVPDTKPPEMPTQVLPPDVRPSIDLRPDPSGEAPPSWGALELMAVVGAFCVAWIASGIVLGVIAIVAKMAPEQFLDGRILFPLQLFIYAVVFAAAYFMIGVRNQVPFWREIRWNWPRRSWFWYLPAGLVLAIVVGQLQTRLPLPKDIPMLKYFGNTGSAYAIGILAVAAAPIIEELFFRGLLYPVLARWVSMWPAIILVAFFFGLVHAAQLGWAWGYVLLMSFVGFVLTTVRARTRSVASSFVLHTAYNFTIFISMWFQTDHFRHLEKATAMLLFRR